MAVMAALVGCGDDGAGTDSTTDGTGSSGTSGPTTSPSTSSTADTSTGTAEGSGSSDGSTTDLGSESGLGSDSGSEGSTGSTGSGSDSTGGSETASACTPIDFTPVVGEAFSGSSGCEGVMANVVLDDAMAVSDHHDAYCESLASCMFPPPECPPQPAIDIEGNRVVYVNGQTNGCSATAMISEVLDCGDAVEVHWVLAPVGPCGLVVYGWDAALIPDGPDVVFIQE